MADEIERKVVCSIRFQYIFQGLAPPRLAALFIQWTVFTRLHVYTSLSDN